MRILIVLLAGRIPYGTCNCRQPQIENPIGSGPSRRKNSDPGLVVIATGFSLCAFVERLFAIGQWGGTWQSEKLEVGRRPPDSSRGVCFTTTRPGDRGTPWRWES